MITDLYNYHPATLERINAIQSAMMKDEITYGQSGYSLDEKGNIKLATIEEILIEYYENKTVD